MLLHISMYLSTGHPSWTSLVLITDQNRNSNKTSLTFSSPKSASKGLKRRLFYTSWGVLCSNGMITCSQSHAANARLQTRSFLHHFASESAPATGPRQRIQTSSRRFKICSLLIKALTVAALDRRRRANGKRLTSPRPRCLRHLGPWSEATCTISTHSLPWPMGAE